MGNEFFDDLAKATGNELAQSVEKGVIGGDVDCYIDTGSYMLNALLSGSIYNGLPGNKTTTFAGEQATGKTFFLLGVIKQFLNDNPTGGVMYFESEAAISKKMIEERGIDSRRMQCIPVATLQQFRFQALKILEKYLEAKEADRPPMIMCLDSLGMLSTTKEVEDTAEGKETKDMTRAQIAKATFRVLTLKLGKAKVPLLVTNHTYDVIGSMYPSKEMGGGSGLKFSADSIIFLSKRKEKDGTEVVGNVIHCKNHKSRLTKENAMVDVLLRYDTGLNRHYGLVELGLKYNIFGKAGNRIELSDGSKIYEKQIYACLLYTSPSPRDLSTSRMPSSA